MGNSKTIRYPSMTGSKNFGKYMLLQIQCTRTKQICTILLGLSRLPKR